MWTSLEFTVTYQSYSISCVLCVMNYRKETVYDVQKYFVACRHWLYELSHEIDFSVELGTCVYNLFPAMLLPTCVGFLVFWGIGVGVKYWLQSSLARPLPVWRVPVGRIPLRRDASLACATLARGTLPRIPAPKCCHSVAVCLCQGKLRLNRWLFGGYLFWFDSIKTFPFGFLIECILCFL